MPRRSIPLFDQTVEDLPSPNARFRPNPQVSGRDGGKDLNLHMLAGQGVRLLGRMRNAWDGTASFADDLEEHLKQADEFAAGFREAVDGFIEKAGIDAPEEDVSPLRAGYDVPHIPKLDFADENITSVIWATGYRWDYSWIDFPVFDDAGYPVQNRGVTEQPGLYFVGLHWLHTRGSGLLLGVGDDAAHVVAHLAARG